MNREGVKKIALAVVTAFLALNSQIRAYDYLESRYSVSKINMESGLPSNYVDDVYRDSDGFLWIATRGGGLCRSDGYDLLTLDTSSPGLFLKSNFVKDLCEDDYHRLWVASEGGLNILDLSTLEASPIIPPTAEDEERLVCHSVEKSSDGCIWLKFDNHVQRVQFSPDGSILSTLVFRDDSLPSGISIMEDVEEDGDMWLFLGGRPHKIGVSASGNLEAVPLQTDLFIGEGTYVSDFCAMGGAVWISTENGLYFLHLPTGDWKHYTYSSYNPRSLTQNFVTGIEFTDEGVLIATTLRGYNIYNPISDDFDRFGNDVINCIRVYGEIIIIGSELDGLSVMHPNFLTGENLSNSVDDPSSLAPGPVNAIWQEKGGRLWVGTVEGGLSVRNPGSGKFYHLTQRGSGLSHNSVSALAFDCKGMLYIGTWGGGIDVLSLENPYRIRRHLPALGSQITFIGALEYDSRNDLLWIGSNQGIFIYDPKRNTYTKATDEPATGCIGSAIDSSGHLWMGCLEGVHVFDLGGRGADGIFTSRYYAHLADSDVEGFSEQVCAILPAADSLLYLGTNGSGFYKAELLENGSYRFTNYSTSRGLSNNRVRGIVEDLSGKIWISTDNGLSLFDPSKELISVYGTQDGLAGMHFFWNAALHGRDGRLYFGHTDGLTVIEEVKTEEPDLGNRLRLTGVQTPSGILRDPRLSILRLHERDRGVVIGFSFLHAGSSSRVHYEYKLEGYDRDWTVLPLGEHSAEYSSVPGGNYTFSVRSLTREGVVVGTLVLPVKVTPYFYKTWWFVVLVSLLLVVLVWRLTSYRMEQVLQRNEALEKTVEERTREISEQKKIVEGKVEELDRQNTILLRQNEELASRSILFETGAAGRKERDAEFMEKVLNTLRENYKDPELDVASFCMQMGMSKTLLNTRLQEATGESIGRFINVYRLTVAREMFQSGGGMNVSEVAYEVGFSDPKYFTRCFSKQFGVTPSSLAKRK